MPVYNIAANQRLARPFQAAREAKAMRAATRYRELTNEGLQRKIDIAPEIEAFERQKRGEEAEASERQATMDKLQGVREILQGIESEDDWERSKEALTAFGGQDPGEYSKEMVGAFKRYTGDVLDIINGIEYFNAIGEPDKAKILEARGLAQASALQAEQDANAALTEYRKSQTGKTKAETEAIRSGGSTKNKGVLTLFVNPNDDSDRVSARLNTPEAAAAIERGMEERTPRKDKGPFELTPAIQNSIMKHTASRLNVMFRPDPVTGEMSPTFKDEQTKLDYAAATSQAEAFVRASNGKMSAGEAAQLAYVSMFIKVELSQADLEVLRNYMKQALEQGTPREILEKTLAAQDLTLEDLGL